MYNVLRSCWVGNFVFAYAWFFEKICYIVGPMKKIRINLQQIKSIFLVLLLMFVSFLPFAVVRRSDLGEVTESLQTSDVLRFSEVGEFGVRNLELLEGTDLPEIVEEKPDLAIKAINPGYKVNGVSEVGELIELKNLSGGALELGGYKLRYTNGSGNSSILLEFPDGAVLNGETLLLRYTKSPEHELADMVYTSSLALSAGPLEILYKDEVVDAVCWTGKTGCEKAFKSADPTTLVRDFDDNLYGHFAEYIPEFDAGTANLYIPPSKEPEQPDGSQENTATPQCYKLEFTEVYSYYSEAKSEQFIELYNPADQNVILNNCKLRYKKKTYDLAGMVEAGGYFAYYPDGKFALTKNPTTSNSIELLDVNGKVVDELTYLHGQKKTTSYAKFYDGTGAENWIQTYARTPGMANNYQEFQTCPAGKVINPETGNCVKTENIATATECPAGKVRNPLTGRCRKVEETASKECQEGYERNPETNRCRKIKKANNGADYAVVPTIGKSSNNFTALWVIIAIAILGVVYVFWQFRREILRTLRKARQRIKDIRKDFVTRSRGRNRNK